jgi:hypothetical protein
MSRNGSRVDDDELSEGDEDFEAEIEDDAQDDSDSSPKKSNKRRKATFVDDAASEEDEVDCKRAIMGTTTDTGWYFGNPSSLGCTSAFQVHC